MDTLNVIIIGVILLLIFDVFFIFHVRRKRQSSFKLVIEKGFIVENNGAVPAEFLYDVQQLARMYKPESLIINGRNIKSQPKLEILGSYNQELRNKIEKALELSLQ